jgi:hypothetical protein
MSTNYLIGYSPNDFFYSLADPTIQPTLEQCTNPDDSTYLDPYNSFWDVSCSNTMVNLDTNNFYFMDFSMNCVKKELCKNLDKVTILNTNENKHDSSEKQYLDVKMNYDIALLDIINLGIGILFALVIIFRNRNVT